MMDDKVLEKAYREQLEEKIITRLAEVMKIGLDKAMSIYYGCCSKRNQRANL